mmetsp:Transcript_14724/g.27279  ORF Transcript_14724/g.27279 Transcript_14724/m.27279 type:complete len:197 (+) Transcript_14724:117-707(+)
MDDLAFVDLSRDDMIEAQPEVYKAFKVMQVGLQYLMYSVDYLTTHCQQAQQSLDNEKKHAESIALLAKRQRAKHRKLKRELEELDAKSYQLDMMTDVVRSEGSTEIGQVVSRLKQAADPAVFDKLHEKLKLQTAKIRQAMPDDLLESDFEISSSHPASFRPRPMEEVKVPDIEVPLEERYSKFNSPATLYFSGTSS